ncbi:T9SS type B sorting domain-containing protein [Winogradskyella damuponensis]|uniref:PKD domain-containing protein n=1 Tax=Winogradskyella damuponensis TaxID=943939 RepID=A0ABP8CT22_9FLAO
MKFRLFLLITALYSTTLYSQCFDCGQNIGGWVHDHPEDIEKVSDGIIFTTLQGNFGVGVIYKYDFNCNLIWSYNLSGSIEAYKTAVDEQENIYVIVANDQGPVNVGSIVINSGTSVIKIDSQGQLIWSRPLGGEQIGINVHYWNNTIFIVGRFLTTISINNEITLTGNDEDYYIAEFDLDGNLIEAENFGASGEDTLIDSEIDINGNIYLTGTSDDITHITKFDSNLNQEWIKEISSYSANNYRYNASNLYYNNTNNKLYLWGSYYNSVNVLGNIFTVSNCERGSLLTEFSTSDGSLENITPIDNCSILPIPTIGGNWRTDNINNGYMYHKNDELFVLTSFRSSLTFSDTTIESTITNNFYNEDLVLFKVNLNSFDKEFVLRTTGENYYPNADYTDGPGPILIVDNDIYLSAFFESYPMQINSTEISNNSGNNNTDVLFYKYKTDQTDLDGLISYENSCFTESTSFEISGDFDSVLWNFNDPASGANNTSILHDPSHTFINIGNYNVTALVTCGTETETINVEVVITESPLVNQIADIYACEDIYGSQISSSFDTSSIESNLIGSQTDLSIKYFNGNGIELSSPLPNPISNSVLELETVTVRVAYNNNLNCYTEVSFDLIVEPLPEINQINNIYACDDDNDGITEFDISNIESTILGGQTGMEIVFFRENGSQLPNPTPNSILNTVPNQETVTARITNPTTHCFKEISFDLIVNPLPIANSLNILFGCDDNNDGISEYFETSTIESQVLNGQTGMSVNYFDQNAIQLSNPLPNPFTNSNPFNEVITIRVTDLNSTCYAETTLQLQTVTQPNINQPDNLYACDQGSGYAEFDTSTIEEQIIGTQVGLTIEYYDSNNNSLPSPLTALFQNTEPFSQTINVRVEDATNPICYSETSFNLIVNELPEINLEEEYFICNLEPSISLTVNSGFNSYSWFFEDGTSISNAYSVEITEEGSYTLTVTQIENDLTCQNSFTFSLVRSELPEIQQVNYGELGNNFIEIITSGNGDFEYSIDGINYQDNNYFPDIQGGTYNVYVRDKEGCGEDSKEVTIIDYPKFFTPNNDGYNDFWQVKGINKFPNSEILIFDRYGKLITQLSSNDVGWDGNYNGKGMLSNDYWFKANLGNGTNFSGHFSLKR